METKGQGKASDKGSCVGMHNDDDDDDDDMMAMEDVIFGRLKMRLIKYKCLCIADHSAIKICLVCHYTILLEAAAAAAVACLRCMSLTTEKKKP